VIGLRLAFGLGLAGTTVGIALAACSSSSSPPPPATTNTNLDAAAGGDVIVIHEVNDGATTAAPPITCGTLTCSAPTSMVGSLAPCCLANNGCGATFGASALSMFDASAYDGGFDASALDAGALCFDTSPGTPDPSCPAASIMGMSLPGCCASDGLCATDLSLAGLGCDSLAVFSSFIAFEAGPPQACGAAADGGANVDSGSSILDGGAD